MRRGKTDGGAVARWCDGAKLRRKTFGSGILRADTIFS